MVSKQLYSLVCLLQLMTSLAFTNMNHATKPYEVTIYNELAYQRYNITIALGNPPQTFPLLLDTGSSDIWVPLSNSSGCAPSCPAGLGFNATLSTTLIDLNTPFEARYGLTPDLFVLGKYYNDSMTVGDLPPLPNAQFAVGDIPFLFFRQGNRGIFGLGSRVQQSVFRGNLSNTYTPVWERLAIAASGERKFAVWLNDQNASTGTVQFGGEDKKKYSGRLKRTKVNLDSSGQRFGWEVNVTSVTRVLPGGGKGRETKKVLTPSNYSLDYTIDTGSPNMYVPVMLYQAIVEGLNVTERINEASYVPCSLRSPASGFLDFGFPKANSDKERRRKGEENFTIRVPLSDIIYPYGYPFTWPLVPDRNGEKMCYFGIVPNEFPRILGATFIRSAYMVFDGDRQEVSMAQAKWDV